MYKIEKIDELCEIQIHENRQVYLNVTNFEKSGYIPFHNFLYDLENYWVYETSVSIDFYKFLGYEDDDKYRQTIYKIEDNSFFVDVTMVYYYLLHTFSIEYADWFDKETRLKYIVTNDNPNYTKHI